VVARALAAAVAVALLAASGAGGAHAQTPKRGGTLVIGTREFREPSCLNAFVATCGVGLATRDLVRTVIPGAYEVTPDATFRPNLVSHVTLTKKPFRLTYHIRPEARWNDGVPVTASDFVFTDQVRKAHLPPEELRGDKIRSVRALDAKTVRVVLRTPYPDWRYLFDIVLPRHALAGEDFGSLWKDEIDNPKTRRAIGSGPFLFGRWERGSQLTFVRNPRYWGPHTAYLDRLVYRFLHAQDIASALRGGEIDMIDPAVAALGATVLELHRQRAPGIRFPSGYGAGYEHIEIRQGPGGHRALRGKQGKLVRQALAYGIDRVEIARTIGTPVEDEPPLEPLDSVAFLPTSPNYQPNWKSYRYRPAHARRLLEQAGCRRGQDRIYSCDGARLEFRFAAPTGVEARQRTVEFAQRQLRQVGVEIRPMFAPPSILFGQILPSGDFDLLVFGWGLGASTAGPLSILGCQQPQNFSGYCDRLVTRDLERATRILDDSRRVALLNRVDARLAKAVPTLPLYQHAGPIALRATVRGVVPNGVGSFAWNAENWWLAE
jgi:peptide/nickel transport system substrate-binding protein